MRIWVAAVLVLGLAACGQPAPPSPASPTAQSVEVQLDCPGFAGATHASLSERFGADNVAVETLSAEGDEYQATVVFPNDPARRLEVTWWDAEARASPYLVMVSSETSAWTGPSGLAMHASLEAIEAANGGVFTLSGFGWDYGGVVLDWNDGSFERADCRVMAYFEPGSGADASAVQGDRPFRSDTPEMRATQPRVRQFGLSFQQPDGAQP